MFKVAVTAIAIAIVTVMLKVILIVIVILILIIIVIRDAGTPNARARDVSRPQPSFAGRGGGNSEDASNPRLPSRDLGQGKSGTPETYTRTHAARCYGRLKGSDH